MLWALFSADSKTGRAQVSPHVKLGEIAMSKSQDQKKEGKKPAQKTAKEKKAAKLDKKKTRTG